MDDAPGKGTGAFPAVRAPDGIELRECAGGGRRSLWFRAEQVRLERPVALKYLRPEFAASPRIAETFIEAGRRAAAIVHPAAAPIFNVYRKDMCISSYWCGGRSLADLAGTLSAAAAAAVGLAVMDCLSSLHATGRCHGNLSPGNLFLDADGGVWIHDFFQPPLLRDDGVTFRGDPEYIAPEVFAGGPPDWTADVFSLGSVLARSLASGANPSPDLDRLLRAMRSPDPAARAGTPGETAAAFARMRREGERARPDKRRERRYRRVPAEFDVSMRKRSATPHETASILRKTRDIGESGVFVETNDPELVVGSIIELHFSLKGVEGGDVHAFGILRWVSRPPLPPGVGVQFVEVDREGLDRLRLYMRGR